MAEAIATAPAADLKPESAALKPKDTKPAPKPAKKEEPKKLSLRDMVAKRIKAGLPKKEAAGMVEFSDSSKAILSKVKYVITTGIEPFDDLVGAFPVGRTTEVYGLEACGKTQLMIRTAIRAQKLCVSEVVRKDGEVKLVPVKKKNIEIYVLYIDNEQSLDDNEHIIHDGERLKAHIMRCDTVDLLFKNLETVIDTCAAYQKDDPDTLYITLAIVDTIASTSSKEEIGQDWNKEDYSRHAKQYRRGFRILTRKINRVNVACICTNQVSDDYGAQAKKGGKSKGGGMSPEDFATFGGKALKYYATHRVFMQKLRDYKINPNSKFCNGMLIGFRSVKNRVTKPFREGRMVIMFGDAEGKGGGFSNEFSILETLLYMKYAEYSESTKAISFKFAKFNVPLTTFGTTETSTTLDEDDEQEVSSKRGKKDPSIAMRAEFPAFYAEHRADVDALYQACIEAAFAEEKMPIEGEDDEEAEEFVEEESD